MDLNDILIEKKDILDMFQKAYQADRLSHAYLFNGKKGTSKLKTALYVACMLYCTDENKPCLKCNNCHNILNNNHLNVHVVTKDNLSIKKEQILELQEEFYKKPTILGKRIYIINEIETMSLSASNSLLKFIEEPINKDTIGILITNDVSCILPTIISRSVVVNFKESNRRDFIKILLDNNFDDTMAYLISNLTNNLDEANTIKDDEDIRKLGVVLENYLLIKNSKDMVLFLINNKKYFDNTKNITNFINLLIIIYEDLIKICYNLDSINLVVYKKLYEEFIVSYDLERLKEALSTILSLNIRLESNVNSRNLLHQILINILN